MLRINKLTWNFIFLLTIGLSSCSKEIEVDQSNNTEIKYIDFKMEVSDNFRTFKWFDSEIKNIKRIFIARNNTEINDLETPINTAFSQLISIPIITKGQEGFIDSTFLDEKSFYKLYFQLNSGRFISSKNIIFSPNILSISEDFSSVKMVEDTNFISFIEQNNLILYDYIAQKRFEIDLNKTGLFNQFRYIQCSNSGNKTIRCHLSDDIVNSTIDIKDDIIESNSIAFTGSGGSIKSTGFNVNMIHYLNDQLFTFYNIESGTLNTGLEPYYNSKLSSCFDIVSFRKDASFVYIWLLTYQGIILKVKFNLNTIKHSTEPEFNLNSTSLLPKIVSSKDKKNFIFEKNGNIYDSQLNLRRSGTCENCELFFIDNDGTNLYQLEKIASNYKLTKIDIITGSALKTKDVLHQNIKFFKVFNNTAYLFKETLEKLQVITIPI